MMARIQTYGSNSERHPLFWPYCISLGAHLLLLVFVVFSPAWRSSSQSYLPSVIDVEMVDLNQISAPKGAKAAEKAAPVPAKEEPSKTEAPKESDAEVSVPQEQAEVKPEVSVAPVRKATKSALKYKTFKSEKVLKNALKRVEKKVDSLPPRPLEDTIKRLRDKVAKEGKPDAIGEEVPDTGKIGTGKGVGGRGGQREIELIDLYRVEIAYAIQKNWAFSDQLAGADNQMVASIVFKVMPDGKIVDIFFTERSGNAYLDDSGYKAIVKTSPVKPFPAGLNRGYIEMGINFTPEGVR
jgi:colicin import membrane protein